ncbi:MAG: hypothetical protein WBN50_08815 [Lutimonas sp.]
MKASFYFQTVFGAVLLLLLQFSTSLLIGNLHGFENVFWLFLSDLMVVFLLCLVAINNKYDSYKLIAIIFMIFFGVGSFNILIEAYIFNVTDQTETLQQILLNAFEMAIFSIFFIKFIVKKSDSQSISFERRKFGSWLWRIFSGNILYLFLYILAGMILYLSMPRLNEFYGDKIPPMELIIKTQIFLRAFVFMAIAVLINRTVVLPKYQKAVLVGLIFSVIGGIAPLIVPNELMPQFVRIGHGYEVGISNFLYGFLLSLLLFQKSKTDLPISTEELTDLKPA